MAMTGRFYKENGTLVIMTDLEFQGKTITVASAMKQIGPDMMQGIKLLTKWTRKISSSGRSTSWR